MKNLLIILSLGVLIVFIGISMIGGKDETSKSLNLDISEKTSERTGSSKPKNINTNSYEKIEDSRGDVSVEVFPLKLSQNLNSNSFQIDLNTHSVDLAYDYKNIITIEDNLGNIYEAQSWEGGSSGHHLEGIVEFGTLNEEVKMIKMTIKGIDNIDRFFEWELK